MDPVFVAFCVVAVCVLICFAFITWPAAKCLFAGDSKWKREAAIWKRKFDAMDEYCKCVVEEKSVIQRHGFDLTAKLASMTNAASTAEEQVESLHKQVASLQEQLDADVLVKSLREQVSSLIDENATLRARVEMNDEAAEIENAIDYAAKHDFVGVVDASGNVEGA